MVDRKKKSTSVHFFTGLIDRAYAAGKASRRTRTVDSTLAVSEFSSGGQGPESKKVLYPSTDSGANSAGGFFAASGSEWKEVSTIHRTGRTKRIPTIHAVPLRMIALRGFLRCWMRLGLLRPWCGGAGDGAHRVSSRNSVDTVRSANVAMMIVAMTTMTPAADARPYSWAV